jgi:hypothetical protein
MSYWTPEELIRLLKEANELTQQGRLEEARKKIETLYLRTGGDEAGMQKIRDETKDELEILFLLIEQSGLEATDATTMSEAENHAAMFALNARIKALRAFREKNRVSSREQNDVRALDAKLKPQFPQKTPRYREIAERMTISQDRVRYIIEGPRRTRT